MRYTTEGNNIVTAINADLQGVVTAARSAATVIVTARVPGPAGNSIPFTENVTNFSMNGGGVLGGTQQGGGRQPECGVFRRQQQRWAQSLPQQLYCWRCYLVEHHGGMGWRHPAVLATSQSLSWRYSWRRRLHDGVRPYARWNNTCLGNGNCECSKSWRGELVVTNNPTTQNLTKATLGNGSFITQVKSSSKYSSVAIVSTNDGNVQIGFNLGPVSRHKSTGSTLPVQTPFA